MKEFNTTAVCIPIKHYMVDLSERVKEIKKLVDAGKYFTINRARQYGKTTTLNALRKALAAEYVMVGLDFQGLGNASFETEETFCRGFVRLILDKLEYHQILVPSKIAEQMNQFVAAGKEDSKLVDLMRLMRRWCAESERPVVLMIDEVDSTTNNQVLLDFLAQLRDGYICRETDDIPAFWSVILASVTDIKHLKGTIFPDEPHKVNSPWNIAADFNVDMSLSEDGISGMLKEYEADHHTGMDTAAIAKSIREYTNGYPFLVSRICQLIDTVMVPDRFETLAQAWTLYGVDEAVKMLLSENNTLFQSITKNLDNYPELKAAIRSILMEGTRLTFSGQQDSIVQMQMHGLIRNDRGAVRIDNRIFETMLYNLFLSDEELKNSVFYKEGNLAKNIFVKDGVLNVELILRRFIDTFGEVYGLLEERFKEKDGRELFLLYLKPIINGTGSYYIEAQTRDQKRTDVIIDYLGRQYIIELKIWRGERDNEEGAKQIMEYLDYFDLTKGYMLSFNFNNNKVTGMHTVQIGGKILHEGVV